MIQFNTSGPWNNKNAYISASWALNTGNIIMQLFPWASNFTYIAQYWLFPGTDSGGIYTSKISCFNIGIKLISIKYTPFKVKSSSHHSVSATPLLLLPGMNSSYVLPCKTTLTTKTFHVFLWVIFVERFNWRLPSLTNKLNC